MCNPAEGWKMSEIQTEIICQQNQSISPVSAKPLLQASAFFFFHRRKWLHTTLNRKDRCSQQHRQMKHNSWGNIQRKLRGCEVEKEDAILLPELSRPSFCLLQKKKIKEEKKKKGDSFSLITTLFFCCFLRNLRFL